MLSANNRFLYDSEYCRVNGFTNYLYSSDVCETVEQILENGGIDVDNIFPFGDLDTHVSVEVTQEHEFVKGNSIYYTGTIWRLANSSDTSTYGIGIVSNVIDSDRFVVTFYGIITGLSSLSGGNWYYTSDIESGSTTTDFTFNRMFYALSDTTVLINQQDFNSTGGVAGSTNFITLSDTPSSFSGQSGKVLRVNSNEDALEYFSLSSFATGSITSLSAITTDVRALSTTAGFTTTIRKEQIGHTLSAGNVVYNNAGSYEKAIANNIASVGVGVVSQVNGDIIDVTFIGAVSGLSGLTPNEWYYCSDSVAGLLTLSQGTTIINPVGYSVSDSELLVIPMRADVVNNSIDGLTVRSEYDSSNSAYLYTGRAARGSAEGDAVWRISRYDFSTGTVTYEDGDQLYNNEWSLREAGSYS